jgi:hypothetical protein
VVYKHAISACVGDILDGQSIAVNIACPSKKLFGDVVLSFGVNDGTQTTNAQINLSVNSINDVVVASSTASTVNLILPVVETVPSLTL